MEQTGVAFAYRIGKPTSSNQTETISLSAGHIKKREHWLAQSVEQALTSLERDSSMKTRLLPVLLLATVFPFAVTAQTTTTNPSGTGGTSSSSDQGSGTDTNTATSPAGTGGTSSSSGQSTSGTSSGTTANNPTGTGGTSSSTSSGQQDTTQPSTTPNATTTGSPMGASMAEGETFVTIPGSGAWRVNDLQGKTVYSSDGSNIGEINDILVSRNGSVNAVIIGVGGFLGMGEKNVAVNISALQIGPDTSAPTGAVAGDRYFGTGHDAHQRLGRSHREQRASRPDRSQRHARGA